MIKPRATQPPHVQNVSLLIIPYTYALAIITLILVQLVAFDKFILYLGTYFTANAATTSAIAIILVGLEVFSVPFLLRLRLSPLARISSTMFTLLTPLAWALVTASHGFVYAGASLLFFSWAVASFWVLGGPQVLKLRIT